MPRQGHTLGFYVLTALVGSGGTSEVFAAVDSRSGRKVALKILREEHLAYPEIVFRFLNEALPTPLRQFRHPGIIEVFETSSPAIKHHYHALELLHGSLTQRLARGPMATSLALRLGRQVADALAALHFHDVVHRDVKPSNLLLTDQPDGSLRIKLGDFGLARLPDSASGALPVSTAEGTRLGTADYMAPEQWENARGVDGAADVYSLGCTLYQMLSGRRPFIGESDTQLRRQHLLSEPSQLPAEISKDVRVLVGEMMAKPSHRRPTARESELRLSKFVQEL